jgi:hypothetical protein
MPDDQELLKLKEETQNLDLLSCLSFSNMKAGSLIPKERYLCSFITSLKIG